MGMYTELVFAAELREPLPQQIVDTLSFMVGDVSEPPAELPKHELFTLPRWDIMLHCDSYYFNGDTHSTLIRDEAKFWSLTVRSNFKNYDNEIDAFLDWIMPHCNAKLGDFMGYWRYEVHDEPTLIYAPRAVS